MSVKDYFNRVKPYKVATSASLQEAGDLVESADYIRNHLKYRQEFIPDVNFATASNFARFGSAEEYYDQSIKYIYKSYPYDGSKKEKVQWQLSASYLDSYLFNHEYPRTNGYIVLGHGWNEETGATSKTVSSDSNDAYKLSAKPQYVSILGGLAAATEPAYSESGITVDYKKKEHKANVYDTSERRGVNLQVDGSRGNTVEFWFKSGDSFADNSTQLSPSLCTAYFDLHNDVAINSAAKYGRLLIESRRTAHNTFQDDKLFHVTYASGSADGTISGCQRTGIGDTSLITTSTFGTWNHFAFTVVNSGRSTSDEGIAIKLYMNGELKETVHKGTSIGEVEEGPFDAYLGAYKHAPSTAAKTAGIVAEYGSISGSFDEFRFWKVARNSDQIKRHYISQVGGGTNTDIANVDLGVYYKFNEGITGRDSTDSNVLDYSGRVTNGTITNYTSVSTSTNDERHVMRNVNSAIVEASASATEFLDPIVYPWHPDVVSTHSELTSKGREWDIRNASLLYNNFPEWIREEDQEKDRKTLYSLSQVLASYFDTLHMQIENLPRIKDITYNTGSAGRVVPFADKYLEGSGFLVPDIFVNADVLEGIDSRNEERLFDDRLDDIKNAIYKNIYNNLTAINKSKGTEKSIRNLIRCFGVDDDIYKLNLYTDNATLTLDNRFKYTNIRKNYADFDFHERFGATVYQYASTATAAKSYFAHSNNATSGFDSDLGVTYECEAIFPTKPNTEDLADEKRVLNYITSSVFGAHTVDATTVAASDPNTIYTWDSNDYANFQVFAVRDAAIDHEGVVSKNVYFKLKSHETGGDSSREESTTYMPTLTSPLMEEVYTNQKWNLAVRIKPKKHPSTSYVSGSSDESGLNSSGQGNANDTTKDGYRVEFYGVCTFGDTVIKEFEVSKDITELVGRRLVTSPKRLYVGAHRTNFTGNVLHYSDTKISSLRAWMMPLTNEEVRSHSYNAANYGVFNPHESAYLNETSGSSVAVPRIKTLALHWDFANVTGSDDSGEFIVEDASSGSADLRYGSGIGKILEGQHTGRGQNFNANSSDVISREYVYVAKQSLPENLDSSNLIEIRDEDDLVFTRDTRPVKHVYSMEKSMYQVMSEEMMNIFAGTEIISGSLDNLIGEPVNKYRQKYKELEKIRGLFFEKVKNIPDFDKFVDYYKWLDESVSLLLEPILATSLDFKNVSNVVESHIFERNKYWHKFPTLEMKYDDPEGAIKGVNELLYNWKYGHAPLTPTDGREDADSNQNENCLWWKEKAERSHSPLDSGDVKIDDSRALIHSASIQIFNRKLTSPLHFEVDAVQINEANKIRTINPWGSFGTSNSLVVKSTYVEDNPLCNDKVEVELSGAYSYTKKELGYYSEFSGQDNFNKRVAPFAIYSSSVDSSTTTNFKDGLQLTNIHLDRSPESNDIPMQGPFTQAHVGGLQHRHVSLNLKSGSTIDDSRPHTRELDSDRPEAWRIKQASSTINIYGPHFNASGVQDTQLPRATYYRDETAKRMLNIRNIKHDTGSVVLGNYDKDYQIVQATGRDVNNTYLVDNAPVSPDTGGGIVSGRVETRFISGVLDHTLPTRPRTEHVMVERFSAPGGPEVMSRGFLDVESETYSVYNAMPWRNLSVRRPLQSFLSSSSSQFGIVDVSTMDTKIHTEASATATVTIKGASNLVATTHTVTIISTDGTTITAYAHGTNTTSTDTNTPTFNIVTSSNTDTATNLATCLNANSRLSATSSGAIVTITQAKTGYDGNTVITLGAPVNIIDKTDFTGGSGGTVIENVTTRASYHKINRNGQKRIEFPGFIGDTTLDEEDNPQIDPYVTGTVYDNWYVQHPIPASERQYAWITASATSAPFGYSQRDTFDAGLASSDITFVSASEFTSIYSSGYRFWGLDKQDSTFDDYEQSMFTDFVGLNLHIYEPISVATNTLGYDAGTPLWTADNLSDQYINRFFAAPVNPGNISIGVGASFNALMLHRNGPYQYPTWKQVRTGDHPIARHMRENNRLSVMDKAVTVSSEEAVSSVTTLTSYTEPPISNNKPHVHAFRLSNDDAITVVHSYTNNLDKFANKKLDDKVDTMISRGRYINDALKEMYVDNLMGDENPIKNLLEVSYRDVLYPQKRNMYMAKTRGRTSYSESVAQMSAKKLGAQRTFWRNSISDRTRTETTALNSQGQIITNDPSRVRAYQPSHTVHGFPATASALANTDFYFPSIDLSVWPLDTGEGTHRIPAAAPFFYSTETADNGADSAPNPAGFGSSSIGELSHFTDWSIYLADFAPTASLCFHHYQLVGLNGYIDATHTGFNSRGDSEMDHPTWVHFAPRWKVMEQSEGTFSKVSSVDGDDVWSKRGPWHDSYDDYADDIRYIAKDYTIVPEFRISEHMDYYLDPSKSILSSKNNKIFTIEGAAYSASADDESSGSDSDFIKTYLHSDFVKYFNFNVTDHRKMPGSLMPTEAGVAIATPESTTGEPQVLTISCNAIMKLLPYNGFYPVNRTVQLGSLLSQSFGPYLVGSNYADTDPGDDYEGPRRMQALLQPFFAPGIMFNTVKSGIAVDWPSFTGSAEPTETLASAVLSVMGARFSNYLSPGHNADGTADPETVHNYRLPFESLVNPSQYLPISGSQRTLEDGTIAIENKIFHVNPGINQSNASAFGGVVSASVGTGRDQTVHCEWLGDAKPNYSLAMNNFVAEVPRFFLENGELTRFSSLKAGEFKPFQSGITYYMDVVLRKTDDMVMFEGPAEYQMIVDTIFDTGVQSSQTIPATQGNRWSARGWGYGPSCQVSNVSSSTPGVNYFGTHPTEDLSPDPHEGLDLYNSSVGDSWTYNTADPSYAPYTPPYFYGTAKARIRFAPHKQREMGPNESSLFSLEEILAQAEIDTYYINDNERALNFEKDTNLLNADFGTYHNLAGKQQMHVSSSVSLFGRIKGKTDDDDIWVINPKFETPVLNFSGSENPTKGTTPVDYSDSDNLFTDPNGAFFKTKGMWYNYGAFPQGEEGIFIEMRESFPIEYTTKNKTITDPETGETVKVGSLLENCGFKIANTDLQDRIGKIADNKTISEAIVLIPVYREGNVDKRFEIPYNIFKTQLDNLQNHGVALLADDEINTTGVKKETTSVSDMIEKMQKYVIPPQMNFLEFEEVAPFVMYILEFTHELSRQDLANIWQGVMPDISVRAEKRNATLQHPLNKTYEFFGWLNTKADSMDESLGIVKWQVFKVKQRAAKNYYELTPQTEALEEVKQNLTSNVLPKMKGYTYNWPYDFFSLIELVQIESELTVKPSPISSVTPVETEYSSEEAGDVSEDFDAQYTIKTPPFIPPTP